MYLSRASLKSNTGVGRLRIATHHLCHRIRPRKLLRRIKQCWRAREKRRSEKVELFHFRSRSLVRVERTCVCVCKEDRNGRSLRDGRALSGEPKRDADRSLGSLGDMRDVGLLLLSSDLAVPAANSTGRSFRLSSAVALPRWSDKYPARINDGRADGNGGRQLGAPVAPSANQLAYA